MLRIFSAALKLIRTPHTAAQSPQAVHTHLVPNCIFTSPPPGSWHLPQTYTYMFVFQKPCCMLYPGKPMLVCA